MVPGPPKLARVKRAVAACIGRVETDDCTAPVVQGQLKRSPCQSGNAGVFELLIRRDECHFKASVLNPSCQPRVVNFAPSAGGHRSH